MLAGNFVSNFSEKMKTGPTSFRVLGLSAAMRAYHLRAAFSKHGSILKSKVVTHKRPSGVWTYGYVTMSTTLDANKLRDVECLLKDLNRTEVDEKMITVVVAKSGSRNEGAPVGVEVSELCRELAGEIVINFKESNIGKCEVCNVEMSQGETQLEHVVNTHMSIDGSCDICGEDSLDFMEHFKVHQNFGAKWVKNPLYNDKAGMADLAPGLRDRFTELYCDEMGDQPDIPMLVTDYLGNLSLQAEQISSIVTFYAQVTQNKYINSFLTKNLSNSSIEIYQFNFFNPFKI